MSAAGRGTGRTEPARRDQIFTARERYARENGSMKASGERRSFGSVSSSRMERNTDGGVHCWRRGLYPVNFGGHNQERDAGKRYRAQEPSTPPNIHDLDKRTRSATCLRGAFIR